jgi:uncharacterized protein YjiK
MTHLWCFLLLAGCAGNPQVAPYTGYNLGSPDATYILPDILREVSGLTYESPSSFACIQDENGIIFIYDVVRQEIKTQYTFHIDGDYEGIAKVDQSVFVLRSDGTLFEIRNYRSDKFQLTTYYTGIQASDNEGLCYDRRSKRLLIACKSKLGKGPEYKDKRVIYGFDLLKKELIGDPVFEFDVRVMRKFALDNHIALRTKNKKKKPDEPLLKFRTSAIGIHPLTGKLYLLSAADYLLFVFDRNGSIEHMETLDPRLFNKAEGISFFDNGDMLITNEGQDKRPTLLRFNYKAP